MKSYIKVSSFSLKWKTGYDTIRDFVPCLDENGVACMYDLITKTPYYDGSNQEFSYETIS